MKYKDIAAKYDVSIDTVKNWKRRCWVDKVDTENQKGVKKSVKEKVTPNEKGVKPKTKKETQKEAEKTYAPEEALTDKQRLFCLCYVKNFNATQAAIKAGYSPDTAAIIGWENLRKPNIKNEIQRLKQMKAESIMINESDIVERYMRIAFADITDFVDFYTEETPLIISGKVVTIPDAAGGAPIPLTKTVNTLRFKDSNLVDGGLICEISHGKDGAKLKLEDRQKALDWLAKYFIMNPLDRHKIDYDNARLELEQAKNVDSKDEKSSAVNQNLLALAEIIMVPQKPHILKVDEK